GRAVARGSDILLFDEPTTNVEVQSKLLLIRAFKLVTRRLKQTIIYVTHDQTEAMTLADRVALMRDGRILQYDTPSNLYEAPATVFAGWFLGNPGMNFLPARRTADAVDTPLARVPLPADTSVPDTGEFVVGVRPEHIRLSTAPIAGAAQGILRDINVTIAGRFVANV